MMLIIRASVGAIENTSDMNQERSTESGHTDFSAGKSAPSVAKFTVTIGAHFQIDGRISSKLL